MHSNEISYIGKNVFIGLDVHRKTYSMSALCDGVFVLNTTIKADPVILTNLICKRFKGANIASVYEAGFSGLSLHRELTKAGIKNIVVHPASIAISCNDKVKTDTKDSKKLAIHLSGGLLKGNFVPSQEQELTRLVCRSRYQFIRMRTRLKNQIRMRLHQFNMIPVEVSTQLSMKLVKKLIRNVPGQLKFDISLKLALWEDLNRMINECNREILASGDQSILDERYRSISGVGILTARILATELGDMFQFPSEKALYRFTGLTPSEHSSGDKLRKGSISKQGSSFLRHTLVQLAWRAIKKDEKLNAKYTELAKRVGKKKAIVAIARKIIGIARALFVNNTFYKKGV